MHTRLHFTRVVSFLTDPPERLAGSAAQALLHTGIVTGIVTR
jgi:hypothetical protein